MWIENGSQSSHRIEVVLGELLGHEIDFFDADAVLTGHAAAEFDAFFEDFVADGDRIAHLLGIAFIVEDQGMDVTIAGMEDVRDAQAVFFAALANEAHDLGQLGARDDAVLREKVWTEAADGAESALAAFPEIHAFLL